MNNFKRSSSENLDSKDWYHYGKMGHIKKNFWHWNKLKEEREDEDKNQKNTCAIVSDDE